MWVRSVWTTTLALDAGSIGPGRPFDADVLESFGGVAGLEPAAATGGDDDIGLKQQRRLPRRSQSACCDVRLGEVTVLLDE